MYLSLYIASNSSSLISNTLLGLLFFLSLILLLHLWNSNRTQTSQSSYIFFPKEIPFEFQLDSRLFLVSLILFSKMGSVGFLKNSTMVCAPLMDESVEQMLKNMQRAKAEGADVVEIRLDCIKGFQPQKDLQILLAKKPLPVITVYRQIKQL